MSEMKEYISRADELGNIHISEDVLAVIAAAAALEVEGVHGLAANLGSDLAELLGGKKNLAKGIRIQVADQAVSVDISIVVKYGYLIPDVAKALQDAVCSSMESMSSLTVTAVNVNVSGISLESAGHKA